MADVMSPEASHSRMCWLHLDRAILSQAFFASRRLKLGPGNQSIKVQTKSSSTGKTVQGG